MSIPDMVAWALAQVGKSYSEMPGIRCGPNSFDCSGLVYKACVNGNVRPPGGTGAGCSTTFSQWADRGSDGNQEVPGNGQFPFGCLVYFDNGAGGPQPGHVGISLGDGTMVNALNTESGVLVCPISYGGTPMGGIIPAELTGTGAVVGSAISDTTSAILARFNIPIPIPGIGIIPGGSVDPLSAIKGVTDTFSNLDKLLGHFSDPNWTKRIGKGALAGLVGLAALLIIREGMSSE